MNCGFKSNPLHRSSGPLAGGDSPERFCNSCAFARVCSVVDCGNLELVDLHRLVEHTGPYRKGQHIFRSGDPFRAIYAIRTGTVKMCLTDEDGREHVLGFYLPGEVIGLNAIFPDHFPCDAVALETSQFCRFSFPAISMLATRLPAIQQHLFRLISKELGMAHLLVGDYSADERMAAFLVSLGGRYAVRGFSETHFQLAMRRGDIANYLRLAAETVSRVLGRFRAQELIEVQGRAMILRDLSRLRKMARSLLPASYGSVQTA